MYHSITFGDKNTWDDWHLVPSSRPVIAPPDVKSKTVDIPGADGELNLTELLNGRPTYQNRTGSIEFIVVNDYWDWDVAYSTIMNYLQGKSMKMVLEDDPAYYYEGRFAVSEWRSDKSWSLITIDYNVYPYKKDLSATDEDWLWDSFDFETQIIQNGMKNLTVDGVLTVTVEGSPQPVAPVITVSGPMTLSFNGIEKIMDKAGDYKYGDILFREGTNKITFRGNGNVTISYRGGRL